MSDISAPVPPASLSSGSQSAACRETRPRLWPGVVILVVEWLLITVPGWVAPATMTQFMAMMWGPVLAVIALGIWWVLGSRLGWIDLWLGLLAFAAAGAAAWPFYEANFGWFGVAIYALPVVTTAWVFWLLITPFLN